MAMKKGNAYRSKDYFDPAGKLRRDAAAKESGDAAASHMLSGYNIPRYKSASQQHADDISAQFAVLRKGRNRR